MRIVIVLLIPLILSLTACDGKKGGKAPKQSSEMAPAVPEVTPTPTPTASPSPIPLPAVVITNPSTSTVVSNSSSLAISGSCQNGATVTVSGDATSSASCASGSFSLSVAKSTDGTWNLAVSQSMAGVPNSASVALTWVRDTVAPSAPVITSPGNNPLISNGSSVTLSGSCETGANVQLAGDATSSQVCAAAAFSFSITKSSDGTFNFTLVQTDPAGNASASAAFQWNRDSVAPAAPTVTAPATNPYISADTNVTISGACETGAMVSISGGHTDTVACAASAYSFAVSKSVDGTYNFSLTQKDAANNTSPVSAFSWTRETSIPTTPVIVSPALSPHYSNGSSLTISGSCTTGYTVWLSGDGGNSMTCASSAFSFSVSASSDGTYNYSILQKSLSNISSASASVAWIRDTVAPAALGFTSPATNPFISSGSTMTLAGSCETGATVSVSGSATASGSCTSGAFSINISKSTDGNYSFNVLQTDLAGNSTSPVALSWVRDATPPAVPTIVSPTSPYISNTSSVTITGGCESQATVALSGDATASTTCALNSYSLTVSKSSDGNFNFSIAQTDLAGNLSATASFTWQRDTVAPAKVTVVTPGSNPYTSSDSNITIAGTCENGALVALSGADTLSATCASSSYSFPVTKSVDGTYNYTLVQTDAAGNASANESFTWIRNSAIPNAPTIDSPSVAIYYSNLSALTISGTCDTGNTVEMSGGSSATTSCVGSAYSFNVSKSTDGTYDFALKQKSASNIYSAAANVRWVRDTVAPIAPTVTTPSTNPKYSNGNSLTISGACESGATVLLAGDATNSVACVSSSYSFTVNKAVDGNYHFLVTQKDAANNVSGAASANWIRDTIAPAALALTSPAANPFASGDTNITLSGSCEVNAAIAMTGDASGSTTCSALGQFSLSLSKSVDATYNFTLVQTDLAGNASASMNFQWIRDTSVPFTPVIVTPAANPHTSNQATLVIEVTCDSSLSPSKAEVSISGDVDVSEMVSPAGSLSQVCNSSPVSFTLQKTVDDVYNFSFTQDNPNAGTTSATADIEWTLDRSAPSMLTITNPASNPFTAPGDLNLVGGCEPNATVYLTGSDTQNTVCAGDGSYSFTVTKSVDATYNFTLYQVDTAGNTSPNKTFQWIRDSNSVPPPQITNPSLATVISNASSFIISGVCNTGYLVTLSGDVSASEVTTPSNSLTQTCAGGSFSYVLAVTTDAVRNFSLKQTFNTVDSSAALLQWTRDTVAPTATISASPSNPNISVGASFTYTSNEAGSGFECKLDSASYATCTSPTNYASVTNGSHTFYVRAIDQAGNVSVVQSYTWLQAAYNALALCHLDSASPYVDSSLFTQNAIVNHVLTPTGTPTADASGKFSTSALKFASSVYASTPSTYVLNNAASTMTVEGFFKLSSSISTTGQYITLISKSAASPNLGWEVRLRKATSSRYVIDFVSSQNGTTSTTVSTSNQTMSTATWYYFAVTWNKGQTKIYFNSATAKVTSGSVGTSTLFASTAAMALGKGVTTGTGSAIWYTGSLDEIRVSQTVRTIAVPTAVFTAD
ncbi:Ig-like domain-containing protein [Bdellovibrio sp. HCB337]|uniref:Ig-like domain-containing protein n=1 Tax=Bdellovibrio sp. HCB337 TaxID=3394358 RepID=UPI0039A74194